MLKNKEKYTTAQAAKLLGIKTNSAWKKIKRGTLKAKYYPEYDRWLIDKEELDNHLKKQKKTL